MIRYNPPSDGSYPPRLLSPLSTIWLPNGELLSIEHQFSFRREGSIVTLSPPAGGTRKTKLNNQLLDCDHVLQDGDFIQHGHETYIFQSDPVAARKKWIQADPELHTLNLIPSDSLRERVNLSQTGISVDQGMTYIPWDQIVSLEFRPSQSRLTILQGDVTKRAKLKLPSKKQEYSDLMNWFYLMLPFDLSIYDPDDPYGGDIRRVFPDAYRAAAYEKIISPAERGERPLPASLNVISGFSSVRKSGYLMSAGCLVVLVLAFIIGVTTGNGSLSSLSLIFFLLFAVSILLSSFTGFIKSRRK